MFGRFRIGIREGDGRWLTIQPRSTLGLDPWQQRLLLVFGLAVAAVAPLAWAFSRRLAAPISALAAGAERLGRDPRSEPLDITGGGAGGEAGACGRGRRGLKLSGESGGIWRGSGFACGLSADEGEDGDVVVLAEGFGLVGELAG